GVYGLEGGLGELAREPVTLRELADQARAQVQGAIAGKRLALRHEIPANLPPAWADRNKLLRVLANLLNNAVKYTERGSITLRAAVAAGNGYERAAQGDGQAPVAGQQYLVVEVCDTGVASRQRPGGISSRNSTGSG